MHLILPCRLIHRAIKNWILENFHSDVKPNRNNAGAEWKGMLYYKLYISPSSALFAQITTKILLTPYLPNRLGLDSHIVTQGRYKALDVPFGGLIDFGLGGSIFGAKNYVFGNKSCTRRISGTVWSWNFIFYHNADNGWAMCLLQKNKHFIEKKAIFRIF